MGHAMEWSEPCRQCHLLLFVPSNLTVKNPVNRMPEPLRVCRRLPGYARAVIDKHGVSWTNAGKRRTSPPRAER